MAAFTEAELKYLASRKLGRLATVGPAGQPHNVPVGFRHDPETDTIVIGGDGLGTSKKARDVRRHPRVAFVVDDVLPPWRPRMLEIRGLATIDSGGTRIFGAGYDESLIRVRPTRIISSGINEGPRQSRDIVLSADT